MVKGDIETLITSKSWEYRTVRSCTIPGVSLQNLFKIKNELLMNNNFYYITH